MPVVRKDADLPFPCKTVFNAVADYAQFPKVFPVIKSALAVGTQGNSTDVEMKFALPPGLSAFLGGSSQTMRITPTPDSALDLDSVSGAMKKLNIRWTFNAKAPDVTHVTFEMDYDTGKSALVAKTADMFVNMNTRDLMKNLEAHIRQGGPSGP